MGSFDVAGVVAAVSFPRGPPGRIPRLRQWNDV